jgi:hypothetical protein
MRKPYRTAILLGVLLAGMAVCSLAAGQEGPFGFFTSRSAADQTTSPTTDAAAKSYSGAENEPRRIPTRLATFGIPIVAPSNRENIKEIQLHVSADLGKTWHLYYRVGPTDKYFPFKAAADGEYWFATRIVDAASRSSATETSFIAEMKVLVDTTPPKLAISSQLTETGEIEASWRASDPLLSPQSLRLEYQTSPEGPWRSIAVPHSTQRAEEGGVAGTVAWRPREATGWINLRAEILDQAGNHSVALDRIEPGAIVSSTKDLEPPIAGPAKGALASAPKQESKKQGPFGAVTRWFGNALGGESTPEADPYASAAPSDELGSSNPQELNQQARPAAQSSWSGDNTELTGEGVKRSRPKLQRNSELANPIPDYPPEISEKRGPGRFASSATVREPSRSTSQAAGSTAENSHQTQRPAIQPPENGQSGGNIDSSRAEDPSANFEPEEIPPPRNYAEPESPPQENSPIRRLGPQRRIEESDEPKTVESLPSKDAHTPVPSLPRERPEEFRTRSPIASGIVGDQRGPARTPATPSYRNASAAREIESDATASQDRLPEGVEPIYTNRLRFGLEYDVNTVGPGGVSEVELWATRDGGQSWSRWGADPDRRSPFEVEVDGEGVFGFRIVVMSRGGLASRPPQPGEEADSWVVVDATAPRVILRGAAYGEDERAGQLEITWDAADTNLTDKSVTLSYSDREEGPWTRIVGDLANQGSHFWRVDSRAPPRIFIKVEVRDGAGNVASDQTREPIRVEGLVPSGKIRRIIPRDADNS